ncbi:MAG: YggT family protein [Firmicutes bacterium]|nr:YggT family protein [Bacillota bacterium]
MSELSLWGLVNSIFEVYTWIIIARVIISWVAPASRHPAVRFVYDMTEPLLGLIRRYIPATGGIDFSPLVALIIVQLVQRIVLNLLISIMY